ncbi:alpha/beta hydrolase [Pseudanabaenaceae cyanobacterium LEGE 13415]|nr:alpha/beta hydrolase [Pseudanabaenaceae cyanobacterium LEGE 13415]
MIQSSPCFLTPKSLRPQFPLFVFLPGMDGTGQLLRAQTAGLDAGFDVRCLAIPPDDLTNWDDLAQHVIDLVKAEVKGDPNRSIYLCGESFGGCLAMKVASMAPPNLFDRLILVNAASSFNRRPWIGWGAAISRHLPQFLYQVSSVSFLPLLAAFDRIAPLDRQALVEAVKSVPQATSIWRMGLLHQFEVPEEELRSLTIPTLILASGKDRLLPSLVEGYRLKAAFQNAEVVVLPESGHTCLLETDVNLYQILKEHDFLIEQS